MSGQSEAPPEKVNTEKNGGGAKWNFAQRSEDVSWTQKIYAMLMVKIQDVFYD